MAKKTIELNGKIYTYFTEGMWSHNNELYYRTNCQTVKENGMYHKVGGEMKLVTDKMLQVYAAGI